MKVDDVLSIARVYLGDLGATRYTADNLKIGLLASIGALNADIGASYTYNAGTSVLDPEPTPVVGQMMGIGIALAITMGEEKAEALDGGGMIWRSGLSSISLLGFQKAIRDSVSSLKSEYERFRKSYNAGNTEVEDIDLYDTGTDLIEVN